MIVAGQPAMNYKYDIADRLIQNTATTDFSSDKIIDELRSTYPTA
jgi:hypothetical protein